MQNSCRHLCGAHYHTQSLVLMQIELATMTGGDFRQTALSHSHDTRTPQGVVKLRQVLLSGIFRYAERQGFEPWDPFRDQLLSRQLPSTARPPLRLFKQFGAAIYGSPSVRSSGFSGKRISGNRCGEQPT